MNLPSQSQLQFQHLGDGRVQLAGYPDIDILVPEGQEAAARPEWEQTLGFPVYEEHWQEWSVAQGMSERHLRFVLCDGSQTSHKGHWRFQPKKIRLGQQDEWLLTCGHTGFVIGAVYGVFVAMKETFEVVAGQPWPEWIEGNFCLMGGAVLYQSRLADAAWRGVQQGILDRVCAVVHMQPGEEPGSGDLIEVALVSEAEAACPGARVLSSWGA